MPIDLTKSPDNDNDSKCNTCGGNQFSIQAYVAAFREKNKEKCAFRDSQTDSAPALGSENRNASEDAPEYNEAPDLMEVENRERDEELVAEDAAATNVEMHLWRRRKQKMGQAGEPGLDVGQGLDRGPEDSRAAKKLKGSGLGLGAVQRSRTLRKGLRPPKKFTRMPLTEPDDDEFTELNEMLGLGQPNVGSRGARDGLDTVHGSSPGPGGPRSAERLKGPSSTEPNNGLAMLAEAIDLFEGSSPEPEGSHPAKKLKLLPSTEPNDELAGLVEAFDLVLSDVIKEGKGSGERIVGSQGLRDGLVPPGPRLNAVQTWSPGHRCESQDEGGGVTGAGGAEGAVRVGEGMVCSVNKNPAEFNIPIAKKFMWIWE